MVLAEVFTLSNYSFNVYAIPPLIVGLTCLYLGLYVYLRNRESKINLFFLLFNLCISIWLVSYFFTFFSNNKLVALFWGKTVYLGLMFMFPSIYGLSVYYLNFYKQQKFIIIGYIVSLIYFMLLVFTDYFIIDMRQYFWGLYPLYKPGVFALPATFIFLFVMIGIIVVINYYLAIGKQKNPDNKRNLKVIFVAHLIAYFACVDFIPKYGVELYPFGYVFILTFAVIYFYAIKKHKLYIVSPVKEDAETEVKQKYDLHLGYSYIISEKGVTIAREVFIDQVMGGKQGLYITRENPALVRNDTPLKKTPMIWLTEVSGENTIDPSRIEELSFAITKFLETAEDSVILLEGLPYLVSYSDFNLVLRLLRTLRDVVSTKKTAFIINVDPSNFSQTDYSLLSGEFHEFGVNEEKVKR